jgi:uncharacterized protein YebE (UPF0316 family)
MSPELMDSILGALMIFGARVCDVSIGTVRVMYTVRGRRVIAATLGLFESGIFIFAVSKVIAAGQQDYIKMIGYALGFSAGTLLGVTVEKMIASGQVMVRVISLVASEAIVAMLRSQGYGVTSVRGEGRSGEVQIHFVVSSRRHAGRLVGTVSSIDPDAFITIESVGHAVGGFMPGSDGWIARK